MRDPIASYYEERREKAALLARQVDELRLRLGLSPTLEVSPRHPDPEMARFGQLQRALERAQYVGD